MTRAPSDPRRLEVVNGSGDAVGDPLSKETLVFIERPGLARCEPFA
jgi:hypothetical protein